MSLLGYRSFTLSSSMKFLPRNMSKLYLPSELIVPSSSESIHAIGCGIAKSDEGFTCCQAGLLRESNGKMWIGVHSRRYVPQVGDRVLGVISGKMGEYFKVDIGSAHHGLLHFLNFEGATRRNRPDLKNGDVVYARVTKASRHMEASLTCVDDESRARGMGKLTQGGLVFKSPLHLVRRLLSPNSKLLELLGKRYKFEITCAMNGRIWLRAVNPTHIVIMRNIILKSEWVIESDIAEFMGKEIEKYDSQNQHMPMETDA